MILYYLDSIKLIELEYLIKERFTIDFDLTRKTSAGIHLRLIIEGMQTAIRNFKTFFIGNGFGTSFLLIHGYYWSGTKYANYHSMYITVFAESGILSFLSLLFYTFIIPIYNKRYSIFLPFVGGLFFYNIFYQVILEPIFWFVIFLYYYDMILLYFVLLYYYVILFFYYYYTFILIYYYITIVFYYSTITCLLLFNDFSSTFRLLFYYFSITFLLLA